MFTHQKTSRSFLIRLSRFKNVVIKDLHFSTRGLTFARPWSYLFWEKISWKKYPARLDFETNFRYELENNAFL